MKSSTDVFLTQVLCNNLLLKSNGRYRVDLSMQKFLPALLVCYTIISQAFASGDPWPVGGRASGMANTSVTLTDSWSLFNNPGGLAGIKQTHLMFCYDNRFGIGGLQSMAAGAAMPLKHGSMGLSVQKLGDALYSEQMAGIAFSHKISHVQLGIKANYVQIHVSDLGTKGALLMEFGGVATITPVLFFGAHVYNFNQAKLASYQDERIPTVMKTGLSYRPTSQLMLNLEAQKDIDFPAMVKAGVEYQIVKHVYLRTGISTRPGISHFGMGLHKKKFLLDYALRTHTTLGLSHHLSVTVSFDKKTHVEKINKY